MTILSSACKDLNFNEPHKFLNYLNPPIKARDGLCVALAELAFEHAYAPIEIKADDQPKLFVFDFLVSRGGGSGEDKLYGKWHEIDLNLNDVTSGDNICMYLNKELWNIIPRLRTATVKPFTFSKALNRIWYTYLPGQYYMVLLSGVLLSYLGLVASEQSNQVVPLGLSKRKLSYTYKDTTRYFAPDCAKQKFLSKCQTRNFFKLKPVVSMVGIHEMIVNTDIIEPTRVGADLVQQLRFCPLDESTQGRRVTKTFKKLFYYKLSKQDITSIQIELMTPDGKPLKLRGDTRVTLKFKQF